jgi:DHA1 family purine ribonucleoside efflux pump-like MFS transporter
MEKPAWGAVFAVALFAAGLTTTEMLPSSLLTPMASDLGISKGLAGQMVTATAVVGFVTSLLIAAAVRNLNRRTLLLTLSILLVISNVLVATTPNLPILLFGRLLLGIVVAGFWSFSASVTMRLVPPALVPRAFSILFAGPALARVLGVPLASYLESVLGWRSIFWIVASLAMLVVIAQFFTLPSLPTKERVRLGTLLQLLKRPPVRLGMICIVLTFLGNAAAVTYLRPFLESVTQVSVSQLSALLFTFGIAGFVGTSVAGSLLGWNLRRTLTLIPLFMSILAVWFVVLGSTFAITTVLVALWGFGFSILPVGWSTWLTREVPDHAESGGGLLVAAIQLAIMLGVAIGGVVIDASGAKGPFTLGGCVLLLCSLVTAYALRAMSASRQRSSENAA